RLSRQRIALRLRHPFLYEESVGLAGVGVWHKPEAGRQVVRLRHRVRFGGIAALERLRRLRSSLGQYRHWLLQTKGLYLEPSDPGVSAHQRRHELYCRHAEWREALLQPHLPSERRQRQLS